MNGLTATEATAGQPETPPIMPVGRLNRASLSLPDLIIPAELPAHGPVAVATTKPPEAPPGRRHLHRCRLFGNCIARAQPTTGAHMLPKAVAGTRDGERRSWEGYATVLTDKTRAALRTAAASATPTNPYFGSFGDMHPAREWKPRCARSDISHASSLKSLANAESSSSHRPGSLAVPNHTLVSALLRSHMMHQHQASSSQTQSRRNEPPNPRAVLAQAQRAPPLPLRWSYERRPRPSSKQLYHHDNGRSQAAKTHSQMSFVY